LPIALTVFFILTVLTNLAAVLMSQPLSYWDGGRTGIGIDIFGGSVTYGAATMISLAVVYLILGTLALSFVNYRWSLIGWLAAEFVHFYSIQQSINSCTMTRWLAALGEACFWLEDFGFFFIAVIFLGVLLAFSFQPAEFSLANKKIEKGILTFSMLLSLIWILIMAGGVVWSVQKPSFGWVLVEVEDKPAPLQDGEAAFDTKRNKLVLFGGAAGYIGDNQWDYKNDTWEWDGGTWIRMPSKVNPPSRLDHAVAYDEERGVVVMFGGLGQNGRMSDTWEWDGSTWTEIQAETHPSARSGHEMVYDPVRGKVVLYGGYDDPTFYNDAWEWDGKNWKWIEQGGDPPVASVFALTYDTDKNLAFGLLSGTPGGTWTWENNTWTRLFPTHEPSNRSSTSLVYDPLRKVSLTFGGVVGSDTTDETWIFDGEDWIRYTGGGTHPSARSDMTMWYDPFRGHVMLFGGRDDSNVFDDLWEFIPVEE
jgi:hypothetical protein